MRLPGLFLARTFTSLCFSCEPKAKVVTLFFFSQWFQSSEIWSFVNVGNCDWCPFFILSTFSKLKVLNFFATSNGNPPPFSFLILSKLWTFLLLVMAIHPPLSPLSTIFELWIFLLFFFSLNHLTYYNWCTLFPLNPHLLIIFNFLLSLTSSWSFLIS